MPLTRELCKLCWHANPIGFAVPDAIWSQVIPEPLQSSVVCIACFIRLADEGLIRWDREIRLYPVSLVTHIEHVGGSMNAPIPTTMEANDAGLQD